MDGQAEKSHSGREQPQWQEAIDLLASGQYEDAAALLEETEAAADANGNADLAIVLEAAREICLAGNDFQAQIDHHQEAYRAATRREQQLRQQLQALLGLISAQMATLNGHVTDADRHRKAQVDRREIPGLLRRVKYLLGHRQEHEPAANEGALGPQIDPLPRENDRPASPFTPSPASAESPEPHMASEETDGGPSLAIYCLGAFRVYDNGNLVNDWTGNKSKLILKYLALHREEPVHRDVLIDIFWRNDEPEAARRNLYQAIYMLRQALQSNRPDFQYILCGNSCYLFNPELDLWIDFQAFLRHYQTGQRLEREGRTAAAMREYEAAENFYEGSLLPEDLYEEWTLVMRERLKNAYLDALDRISRYYWSERHFSLCVTYCQKILVADRCREDAHRRLMLAYLQQGHRHLALRQYHRCVEAFRQELDTEPMPATVELYEKIKNNHL